MKTQNYRFFDQLLELRSDHADTLALMNGMFRRFAVTDDENSSDKLKYEVLTNVGGQAKIETKDYCYIVEQPALLPSLAHGIILRNTLQRIGTHLLFHAAALSLRGKGIILAADSGCGKTTLALALVRQGFKFLSDEATALGLSNGELAPYPRCLWVRAGTYRIFQQIGWDFPSHHIAIDKKDRKAIHLSSALLGNNCQPSHLIIIQRPNEAEERICEITLDSLPGRLLADLKAVMNVQMIDSKRQGKNFPVIKAKEAHLNKIYKACEQQNVLVLDVEETAVDPSYYEKTPELQEISKLTAALALLRSFLGGYRSVLVQQGSAAGLIQPLIKILEPVICYQLTPGRLEQTVEIINDLC